MIVGVDIGGTKIAAAGFDSIGDGRLRMITDVRTAPTPAIAGGPAIVNAVAELAAGLCGGSEIAALGVGTAGVVGTGGGITSATDAISGWAGFPLRTALADAVGAEVAVLNDVHAAAVAEAAVGAAAAADSMLMVAIGTGIGGAVVFSEDGLRRGATGTAGSLGHMDAAMREALAARPCPCGARGHVEAAASGPALEQTYFEETGVRVSLREIAGLGRDGDEVAAAVISEGGYLLGRVLASANALLDVDMIVIGGGVAEIGERYLEDVEASYRAAALPGPSRARIVAAQFRVNATLTGAAINAMRN